MSKQVVTTAREGSVLVIRLGSPENRNSMTMEMREQLGEAVELAERAILVQCGLYSSRLTDRPSARAAILRCCRRHATPGLCTGVSVISADGSCR